MNRPTGVHPGPPRYTYGATVVRVHDGDTIIADIILGHIGRGLKSGLDTDYGFHIRKSLGWLIWRWPIRLAGLNAIELASPGGPEARNHLAAMFDATGRMVIATHIDNTGELDKYDRVLADVWPGDQVLSVNDRMVADGYAARWDGNGPRPTPPWPIPTPQGVQT